MGNQHKTSIEPAIVDFVREAAFGNDYAAFFRETLPLISNESHDWVQQIRTLCPNAAIELTPDRTNLFVTRPGSNNQIGVVVQANADSFYRTGSQLVLLLAHLNLMTELETKFGPAKSGSAYQIILDANSTTGDSRYAAAPLVLFQPTDLQVCTGHVGVVSYRCKLSVGRNANMTAVELFPFVVLSLESEARRLKRETDSPGFDAAQVYSNHGVLGCYGQHPAAVCERVSIHLITLTNANPERIAMKLTQFLEEASAEYVARYAPNISSLDVRHFNVTVLPSAELQNFRIDVFGQAGHPATQTDNAITKAALLFGGLLKIAGNYPGMQAYGRLVDANTNSVIHTKPQPGMAGAFDDADRSIILRGLQTFSPAHRAQDVQKRMLETAIDAVKKYCKLRRRKFDASMMEMSFEGLSCEAKPPNEKAPAQALQAAASSLGQRVEGSKTWPAWCSTHQDLPLAIFGPGRLSADQNDSTDIAELQKALAISVLATRDLTSSV